MKEGHYELRASDWFDAGACFDSTRDTPERPQFSREQAPVLATADAYRASWQARKAYTAASVPGRGAQ